MARRDRTYGQALDTLIAKNYDLLIDPGVIGFVARLYGVTDEAVLQGCATRRAIKEKQARQDTIDAGIVTKRLAEERKIGEHQLQPNKPKEKSRGKSNTSKPVDDGRTGHHYEGVKSGRARSATKRKEATRARGAKAR